MLEIHIAESKAKWILGEFALKYYNTNIRVLKSSIVNNTSFRIYVWNDTLFGMCFKVFCLKLEIHEIKSAKYL